MSGPAGRVTRGAGKDTAGFGGGRTGAPPADMLPLPLLRLRAPPPPPSARLHLPGSRGHRHRAGPPGPGAARGMGRGRAAPGRPRVTWAQVSAPTPRRPRGSRAKVRPPPSAVLPAPPCVCPCALRPCPAFLLSRGLVCSCCPALVLPPLSQFPTPLSSVQLRTGLGVVTGNGDIKVTSDT